MLQNQRIWVLDLKDPSVSSTMNQHGPASDTADHWGKEKSLKVPDNWADFIIKDQESEKHQERKRKASDLSKTT